MSNVPSLRFPEFEGEWEEENLGDMCDIKGGGTPPTNSNEYWNGEVHWYTPSEIGNAKYVYGSMRKITKIGLKKSSAKLLPVGTILLTTRASLGDMAITMTPCTTNQGFQSLIAKKGFLNEFIYYCQPLIKKHCNKAASGSTFLEISKYNLSRLSLKIPTLPEQTKIAGFLNLIDKKITKQDEKVAALEEYKKGLMQKIFSREIRFKDDNGEDYPEWETASVSDLYELTRGVVIAKTKLSAIKTSFYLYPVYSSQTSNNGILGYDSSYDFEGDYLTWTTDGANAGRVFYRNGRFRCTNVCGVMKDKEDTKGYANTLMKEILDKLAPKFVSYVGNPKLMNNVMSEIQMTYPTLPEQTKIANFLSLYDRKIEKEKAKLEALRKQKKGLLQQMFV